MDSSQPFERAQVGRSVACRSVSRPGPGDRFRRPGGRPGDPVDGTDEAVRRACSRARLPLVGPVFGPERPIRVEKRSRTRLRGAVFDPGRGMLGGVCRLSAGGPFSESVDGSIT